MKRYLKIVTIFFTSLFLVSLDTYADTTDDIINEIFVEIEKPIDPSEHIELKQYLSFLLKQPANKSSTDIARKNLLNLDVYSSVKCEIQKIELSNKLFCLVKRIPIIEEIIVKNLPLILLEADLRKRLPIHVGDKFEPNSTVAATQLEKIKRAAESFLERQGFFEAEVITNYAENKISPTVNIIITIKDGVFRRVNLVKLSSNITFNRQKIKQMFRNMCLNFDDIFNIFTIGGFNCYSRERERQSLQNLQAFLDKNGYPTASVSIQKIKLNPESESTPKQCKIVKPKNKSNPATKLLMPTKCLDINIAIDLGPQVIVDFKFINAQSLSLNSTGTFFRSFFGIELFSRLLNTSFTGSKWPADETILVESLRQSLSFNTSRKIDEQEINQSILNIKSNLAERGYYNPNVTADYDNFDNKIVNIKFTIEPNTPYYVSKISITGNAIFPESEILAQTDLPIKPRSGFYSGHYDDATITQSANKLKSFYLRHGYPDAQISTEKILQGQYNLELFYRINPGAKYSVTDLNIVNSDDKLLSQILPILTNCSTAKNIPASQITSTSVCQNSPYIISAVADDANRITDIYRNNGYLNTTVETKILQDKTNATITYVLNEKSTNPQIRTAGVLVDGNVLTKQSVILRQMDAKSLTNNAVLNNIIIATPIRALRQTNLFSRINYQLIRNINDPNKDYILLSLTEKPSLTLDFSLGYSSDNLFSLGTEFNHNNLFGDMVQWKTQLELGLFWGHQSGLQNLFRWPQIYGLPLNLKLIIPQITFTNFVDMQPVERHLLLQLIANLDWQLSNKFLPFFQYEIRWDKWLQKDTEPASFSNLDGLLLTTQEDSTARIILTPGIRYIDLDHPFNPTNGLQLNLSANFSFALLGEQFPFTIFNTQIIHYITKGPFTFASQIIFRRAFIKSPRDNWWELKYQSDMETLGGDLTVRGYQPNTIGIFGALRNSRDGKILKTKDGQEIEDYHPGNMSLQANFEIRFPLKKNLFIGDLNGVVFTDFGLIDNCTGLFQCSLGTAKEQINQQLGWSVGLGLRYILPIGPISFDWAISPIRQNPSSWLGYESRFHLLFGYMF